MNHCPDYIVTQVTKSINAEINIANILQFAPSRIESILLICKWSMLCNLMTLRSELMIWQFSTTEMGS